MHHLIITRSNTGESDIVKMDILLNGEKVDALSALIHRGTCTGIWQKALRKIKGIVASAAVSDCHTGCDWC